jgi:hypothetical protein
VLADNDGHCYNCGQLCTAVEGAAPRKSLYPEPSEVLPFPEVPPGVRMYAVAAMCLICNRRWLGKVTPTTSLFKLECPDCGAQDSFASMLPDEYLAEHRK